MPAGVADKLWWAGQHLNALTDTTRAFTQLDPYATRRERRDNGRRYVYVFEVRHEPPIELSLQVGDFLHNLRSTLDHLLYAIATTERREPLPLKEASAIQFPITDGESQFKKQAWRLRPLPKEAQAAVEGLQVFSATLEVGETQVASGIDVVYPLYALRDLSNFEKHRELPIVAAGLGVAVWRGLDADPRPSGYRALPREGELTHGTELAEVTFAQPVPDVEMQIEFDAEWHPTIRTRDISEYWSSDSVPKACRRMFDFVIEVVLPRFAPFL